MRRVGLILAAVGLAGFLFASSQRARYESPEGAAKALVSATERSKRDAWETARWLLVGVAVIGLVFTILPGKADRP
jgi:hypothetical protein